jgi:hypothetical protein
LEEKWLKGWVCVNLAFWYCCWISSSDSVHCTMWLCSRESRKCLMSVQRWYVITDGRTYLRIRRFFLFCKERTERRHRSQHYGLRFLQEVAGIIDLQVKLKKTSGRWENVLMSELASLSVKNVNFVWKRVLINYRNWFRSLGIFRGVKYGETVKVYRILVEVLMDVRSTPWPEGHGFDSRLGRWDFSLS